MAGVVARFAPASASCIPGRDRQKLADVIKDQFEFLDRSLEIADNAGISREAVVLDPGFGFAKDEEENVALMARFGELSAFGLPVLAGTSPEAFHRVADGRDSAADRDIGTAATTVVLRLAGAAVFRVHNVAATRDALAIADAVLAKNHCKGRCLV